jgi:hypothetical protein
MGDSATTIIAIFLAAILMFVFPLMTMADKKDDVSTLTVQTATTEFTDTIRTTGKLTQEKYDNFTQTLASTGNTYNVDLKVQVLDENPAKKESSATQKIGDNIYYVIYTTQVLDAISKGDLVLKEGDIISVGVEITNPTTSDILRNFVFRVKSNNSNGYIASDAGIVTENGQ